MHHIINRQLVPMDNWLLFFFLAAVSMLKTRLKTSDYYAIILFN